MMNGRFYYPVLSLAIYIHSFEFIMPPGALTVFQSQGLTCTYLIAVEPTFHLHISFPLVCPFR
ncbi:hypothetical protein BDW59DRAFT_62388 [Aspergillus cavernicola]|uniref:Uncharacterized protein n=1 Tax=Aspergillus cavernicola TaxID=176166 RepID=A0ABR4IG93_9EURO